MNKDRDKRIKTKINSTTATQNDQHRIITQNGLHKIWMSTQCKNIHPVTECAWNGFTKIIFSWHLL